MQHGQIAWREGLKGSRHRQGKGNETESRHLFDLDFAAYKMSINQSLPLIQLLQEEGRRGLLRSSVGGVIWGSQGLLPHRQTPQTEPILPKTTLCLL